MYTSFDINLVQTSSGNGGYCFSLISADQNTGGALLEFLVRTAMHGKSRVSSAIKYDFFKLDDSENCIIGKT